MKWWTSVRSMVTMMVAATFCYLGASAKLDAKDFMIIALLVFNFYFLEKKREEEVKK
jgi:hypothetical protein